MVWRARQTFNVNRGSLAERYWSWSLASSLMEDLAALVRDFNVLLFSQAEFCCHLEESTLLKKLIARSSRKAYAMAAKCIFAEFINYTHACTTTEEHCDRLFGRIELGKQIIRSPRSP